MTFGRFESSAVDAKRAAYPRSLKLVYWGPGESGKTTNLLQLSTRARPEQCGRLVSLDTPGERTVYFDCLPLDLRSLDGGAVRLRLYTVPGQGRFARTRALVLRGALGTVFVWDARPSQRGANLTSLLELRSAVRSMSRSWGEWPCVIQVNKRDLPGADDSVVVARLLAALGERRPVHESIASQGAGVIETLAAITRLALSAPRGVC